MLEKWGLVAHNLSLASREEIQAQESALKGFLLLLEQERQGLGRWHRE